MGHFTKTEMEILRYLYMQDEVEPLVRVTAIIMDNGVIRNRRYLEAADRMISQGWVRQHSREYTRLKVGVLVAIELMRSDGLGGTHFGYFPHPSHVDLSLGVSPKTIVKWREKHGVTQQGFADLLNAAEGELRKKNWLRSEVVRFETGVANTPPWLNILFLEFLSEYAKWQNE